MRHGIMTEKACPRVAAFWRPNEHHRTRTRFSQSVATPIGVYRLAGISDFNAELVEAFKAIRAEQLDQRKQAQASFFASDDDLVQRVKLKGWDRLVQFIVERIHDTAESANAGSWPAQTLSLKVVLNGMWFQLSNSGAFHEVHTHGNCSWSGVYVVQIDEPQTRVRHPVYGAANGITGSTDRPSRHWAARLSTWATPICCHRIATSNRCRDSSRFFRHGWPIRPCPIAANSIASLFRSMPACTPPAAIACTITARPDRALKRLQSPARNSAGSRVRGKFPSRWRGRGRPAIAAARARYRERCRPR